MRQSLLFTKTSKTAPKDEVSVNASLLIRAGFVHKEMAGVYSYLPLGFRVLEKIKGIIREEMNKEGGQEVVLTALQDPSLWQKTDRWDDTKVDNWFKTTLKNGTEVGLGITHEEPITRIMTSFLHSYKELPRYAYQFQNKFRNETRAKSGIMRGREFLMKDMYDFSRTQEEHEEFYNQMRAAYQRIFARLGIGDFTHITFASGGIFSEFSEEFQTVSEAGEDTIYVDSKTGIALNKEVYTDEVIEKLGLEKENLVEKKSVEVGNIFHLGTKFSEPLGLFYSDREGNKKPVYMGSYGLGPTRAMGTIVEVLSDEKGIVWPESIAPFQVHLIALGDFTAAEKIYVALEKEGIEVLYDDRDARAGEKFTDADLIGIPHRIVVGKSFAESGKLEYKKRTEEAAQEFSLEELVTLLKSTV